METFNLVIMQDKYLNNNAIYFILQGVWHNIKAIKLVSLGLCIFKIFLFSIATVFDINFKKQTHLTSQ